MGNTGITDLIKQANELTAYLIDKKSKMIYEQRLLFSLTKDNRKILQMIDGLFEEKIDYSLLCSVTDENKYLSVYDIEKPLVLYGAGVVGMYYYQMLGLNNQNNIVFCDRRAQDYKIRMRVPVISSDFLINELKNMVNIAIVAPVHLKEIKEFLLSNGIAAENIYYLNFPMDVNESYFDPVVELSENEVFVDAGALDGSTSRIFAEKVKLNYKKIYMFEPDNNSYKVAKNNITKFGLDRVELHEKGLWSKKGESSFAVWGNGGSAIVESGNIKILVDSLDNIIGNDEVTFIKMDIEGSELEALKGAEKLIKRCKPKLAICVYHKPEDIIEIPMYIKSLVPEYKLYLRHYSFSASETVLYAVI